MFVPTFSTIAWYTTTIVSATALSRSTLVTSPKPIDAVRPGVESAPRAAVSAAGKPVVLARAAAAVIESIDTKAWPTSSTSVNARVRDVPSGTVSTTWYPTTSPTATRLPDVKDWLLELTNLVIPAGAVVTLATLVRSSWGTIAMKFGPPSVAANPASVAVLVCIVFGTAVAATSSS